MARSTLRETMRAIVAGDRATLARALAAHFFETIPGYTALHVAAAAKARLLA